MIDTNSILQYILQQRKTSSLDEINEIINKIDRKPIEDIQAKRFRYEVWDKKKYINGVSPKEIIKNRTYKIDKAFLIYIDDELVYFQDHKPGENGYIKMKKAEAAEAAEKFINDKIQENVDNIIAEKVINEILSK